MATQNHSKEFLLDCFAQVGRNAGANLLEGLLHYWEKSNYDGFQRAEVKGPVRLLSRLITYPIVPVQGLLVQPWTMDTNDSTDTVTFYLLDGLDDCVITATPVEEAEKIYFVLDSLEM